MESLDDLNQQFGDLYESHILKLINTKMYCPSWWTGIHTSCKAALNAYHRLVSLENDSTINGCGGKLVKDVDEVAEEDSIGSIDSNLSWNGVLSLDNTNTGNPTEMKSKICPLLVKGICITDTAWGLNSTTICILDPITSCMTKLQKTG